MPFASDKNLLFGILTLQLDLIDSDNLLNAMKIWSYNKTQSLEVILLERGYIEAKDCDLLQSLVERHIDRYDGDIAESVLAVCEQSGPTVREFLPQIDDSEIQATLGPVTRRGWVAEESIALGTVMDQSPTGASNFSGFAINAIREGSRFRSLSLLAKGNLGEVFVAHDQELNRQVALKQIKESRADDEDVRNRFCFEAEVTGGLEHPGIVPVYGLGRNSDGRPYYAMRLIRGESLAHVIDAFHADESTLKDPGALNVALQKLLRRFLDVCDAIAYAHSRGVIHRDLKPSNIMVGGYGETLVVDWGLACLFKQEHKTSNDAPMAMEPLMPSGLHLISTLAGEVVGTPSFMSPEQAAGRVEAVGLATDIYSLGATLYYLLVGKSPFRGPDLQSVLQNVVEGRFNPPRTFNATISKALDAITCKAMALRPEDRYATASDLAEDIEAWLADEPVSARTEAFGERVLRWARKNRSATMAALIALVSVTLVTSVATIVIGLAEQSTLKALESERIAHGAQIKATQDKNLALIAAQKAQEVAVSEANKAKTIIEFLGGIFQSSDPIALAGRNFGVLSTPPGSLKASDVLLRGEIALEKRTSLDEQPLIKSAVLDSLGDAYFGIGENKKAGELIGKSLKLLCANPNADELAIARSTNSLGLVKLVEGDLAAIDFFRQSLEIRKRKLGAEDPLVAECMFNLALALRGREGVSGDEINDLIKKSLAIRKAKLPQPSREVAIQLVLMGVLEYGDNEKNPGAALPYFIEASNIAAKLNEMPPLRGIVTTIVKAISLEKTLGLNAALPFYQSLVHEGESAFGPNHVVTGYLYKIYGLKLIEAGQFKEATLKLQHAIKILNPLLSEGDNNLAQLQVQLAKAYLADHNYKASYNESRAAIERLKKVRFCHVYQRAWAASFAVLSAIELGNFSDDIIKIAQDNIKYEREWGRDQDGIANSYDRLGRCLEGRGQFTEAIQPYEEALKIYQLPELKDRKSRRDELEAKINRCKANKKIQ